MSVAQTQIEGERFNCGIGFIAIPSDIDREVYIRSCYKQNRVSIKTRDGGFINRVPVGKNCINLIEFPLTFKDSGSPVVWVNEPNHNQPIIIEVLNKDEEYFDLVEHQSRFIRKYKNNLVEIVSSPKNSYIGITVDSEDDSEIYLNVYNKNKTGKLNITVQGDVNISTEGIVNFEQNIAFVSETTNDEDTTKTCRFTQTDEEQVFEGKIFRLNSGSESMLLGNMTKKFLDSFIDEVAKSTVTTALGQMPLLNSLQIKTLKNRTEELLSEVGFLE